MSIPLDITIGIELECIAAYPRDAFTNKEPGLVPTEDELDGIVSAGHALQWCLEKNDVPATGWEEVGTQTGEQPFSKWTVSEDTLQFSESEMPHLPDDYLQEPIELSSRILGIDDEDWQEEICRVLDTFEQMKQRFGVRFYTNLSTGFHVHVGHHGGEELPLHMAKRIFQLATAHERNFDGMHASSRVLAPVQSVESDHSTLLYAPLSYFHHNEDRLKRPTNGNIFTWLARIEDMHTFEDLGKIFQVPTNGFELSGHHSAVNFDNLWPDYDTRMPHELKNTVEFRQHVGTLDRFDIIRWVQVVGSIARFCHDAPEAVFINLLLRGSDLNFETFDLLRAIGCDNDVIAHFDSAAEPAEIGVLGEGGDIVMRDDDQLINLTAQNDDEATENSDVSYVKVLVEQKLLDNYYGIDQLAGPVTLDQRLLCAALEHAYQKVSQDPKYYHRGECIMPRARALVFSILGEMYAGMDNSLEPDQSAAVVNGLHRLLN